MEEDIRKQGMLFLQQQRFGKKWKRVWCVLYRESSCSISRLEFFEYKDGGNVEKNDKTLRKLQESKKVIRMADCIRVTEVDMDGCPRDTGSFLVETTEKIYVFAVDRNQLDDWTHKLCEIAFPMSWMEAGAKRGTLQRGNKVDEDKGMEDNSLYSGQDRGTPVSLPVHPDQTAGIDQSHENIQRCLKPPTKARIDETKMIQELTNPRLPGRLLLQVFSPTEFLIYPRPGMVVYSS